MKHSDPRDTGTRIGNRAGTSTGKDGSTPKATANFRETLALAVRDLTPAVEASALDKMTAHWEQVQLWAERLNLTSIHDPEGAAWLHYRDSLEALTLLDHGPIVDMGTGAGFPGIPLAIVRTDLAFTLVEPRRKRGSFLLACVARLGLKNVKVLTQRSDEPPPQRFACLVTRATFSSDEDLRACAAWLEPNGRMLAFRSEPSGLGAAGATQHTYQLRHDRRLIEIWTPHP